MKNKEQKGAKIKEQSRFRVHFEKVFRSHCVSNMLADGAAPRGGLLYKRIVSNYIYLPTYPTFTLGSTVATINAAENITATTSPEI